MCQHVIMHGVTDGKLQEALDGLRDSGGSNITKHKDEDGTWTVEADMPD